MHEDHALHEDYAPRLARPPSAQDPILDMAHLVKRTLEEQVFYPEHSSRTRSPLYAHEHHRMILVLDLPCAVCGVRNSTLHDPTQNRHGASQMETHHFVIEWALQNAIDVDRFNERIVRPRRALPDHDPLYEHDFSEVQMRSWIDHHTDNLLPLCDTHHRHAMVGIHAVTFPIWNVQGLIRDDFQLTPLALQRIERIEARHEAT